MRCIQDVPITSTLYVDVRLVHPNGSTATLAVDWHADAATTAQDVLSEMAGWQERGFKPAFTPENFRVREMAAQPTREQIADSVRRAMPKRTLLTVQQTEVFPDDLNVSDYWRTNWSLTAALLREIERRI